MTTLSKAKSVPCALPNPALPRADWGDCFEIEVADQTLNAIQAAELALGRIPRWIRMLMNVRNRLVRIIGLKPAPDDTLIPRQSIGAFPLVSKSAERVILGLDDYHLDFRIVIDVRQSGATSSVVSCMTLVKRKNLLGWIYLGVVKPFHKVIVPAILVHGLQA